MITPEMEDMYSTLVSLTDRAVMRNDADDYLGLMVDTKKGKRIAVGIHTYGTSFSTENESLLERLRNAGISFEKDPSEKPKLKSRYIFRSLTTRTVEENADIFQELIAHSIKSKQQAS